jgi:hypothetical protein
MEVTLAITVGTFRAFARTFPQGLISVHASPAAKWGEAGTLKVEGRFWPAARVCG